MAPGRSVPGIAPAVPTGMHILKLQL